MLCVKVLLPDGVEDGQGDASEGILDLWQVRAISEHNWVFRGWMVDNSSQRGAPSKVAIDEATKEEGDLEVVANNLDVFPQVFPPLAEEDIVGQFPEYENKCSSNF